MFGRYDQVGGFYGDYDPSMGSFVSADAKILAMRKDRLESTLDSIPGAEYRLRPDDPGFPSIYNTDSHRGELPMLNYKVIIPTSQVEHPAVKQLRDRYSGFQNAYQEALDLAY